MSRAGTPLEDGDGLIPGTRAPCRVLPATATRMWLSPFAHGGFPLTSHCPDPSVELLGPMETPSTRSAVALVPAGDGDGSAVPTPSQAPGRGGPLRMETARFC